MKLEVKCTRYTPPGQFLKYFKTYVTNSMKLKVTYFAQKKAGIDYDYWQKSIERINHISKSELN